MKILLLTTVLVTLVSPTLAASDEDVCKIKGQDISSANVDAKIGACTRIIARKPRDSIIYLDRAIAYRWKAKQGADVAHYRQATLADFARAIELEKDVDGLGGLHILKMSTLFEFNDAPGALRDAEWIKANPGTREADAQRFDAAMVVFLRAKVRDGVPVSEADFKDMVHRNLPK